MADDQDLLKLIEAPFQKPGLEQSDEARGDAGRERRTSGDVKETSASRRSRSRTRSPRGSDALDDAARRSENGHRRSRKRESRSRSRTRRNSRSKSRERDRGSHRSNKTSDRRRSRSRDTHSRRRSRDYERSKRDSSRDSERRRHGEKERSRDLGDRGTQRPSSPVLSEIERDKRTVFCMQLAARLREKELHAFLEKAGRVRDARIITDRNSGRSKGVGYVEFYDEESVPAAIALTGQKLLGIPIIVTITEAEKNRQAEAAKAAQAALGLGGKSELHGTRLHVGNVHINLTEENVRQVFEPFGFVESVSLHPATDGRSNGFAFVQFRNPDDAKMAMQHMNGFELGGRQLKVNYAASERPQTLPMGPSSQSLSIDEGDTNFAMTAQTRAELMKKLAARSSSDLFGTEKPKPPAAVQTAAIRLTNMFVPEEETEPDWDAEIGEDVREEAEKFGRVVKLRVDKQSQGHVYIAFDSPETAQRAITAMNGRRFAGRVVVATMVPEQMV